MKSGLGHLLATLLLVQCSPAETGLPAPEDASATHLKSDSESNPSENDTGAGVEPPTPEIVPGSPVPSGPAQAAPRLVVKNAYLRRQYVFLGSRLLGSVAPGAEGSFEVLAGAHSVTFSDSKDGRTNRKTFAEVFDSGFAYHYDVLAH